MAVPISFFLFFYFFKTTVNLCCLKLAEISFVVFQDTGKINNESRNLILTINLIFLILFHTEFHRQRFHESFFFRRGDRVICIYPANRLYVLFLIVAWSGIYIRVSQLEQSKFKHNMNYFHNFQQKNIENGTLLFLVLGMLIIGF